MNTLSFRFLVLFFSTGIALSFAIPAASAGAKKFAGDSKPYTGAKAKSRKMKADDVPRDVDSQITTASTGKAPHDPDIKRNLRYLKGAKITLHRLKDRAGNWKIYEIKRGRGPKFVVLHDNEHAAFDAAARYLAKSGGTLIAVEAGERRFFGKTDPNRYFGSKCRGAKYTALMNKLVGRGRVISLHTNARGYSGDGKGGRGHINVYRKSRILQGRPARRSKFKDGDTFVLVPARSEASVKGKVRKLNRNGIHAMFEKVTAKTNDCSMSNYWVLNRKGAFATVEAPHKKTNRVLQLITHALRL